MISGHCTLQPRVTNDLMFAAHGCACFPWRSTISWRSSTLCCHAAGTLAPGPTAGLAVRRHGAGAAGQRSARVAGAAQRRDRGQLRLPDGRQVTTHAASGVDGTLAPANHGIVVATSSAACPSPHVECYQLNSTNHLAFSRGDACAAYPLPLPCNTSAPEPVAADCGWTAASTWLWWQAAT